MIPAYAQNQVPQAWNQLGAWGVNPAPLPQTQPPGIDGVAFVQGYNAALAYVVPAGKTFLLIDTVEDRIYFKSADAYGRPSPLNDFWLSKEKPEPKEEAKPAPEPEAKAKRDEDEIAAQELATKDDIDELRAMIESLAAKKSPGRSRKEETEDE